MKFSFLLLFKPGEALLKGEALGVLAVDVLLEVNLGRGAEEGGAADLADEGEGRGVVLEAGAWFVFELEGGKGVRGGGGGGERWRAKRRRRRRQRRLASFIPFSFFFFALTFAGARRLGQVLGPGDGRLLRVASAHFVKESLELNGRRERERGRKNVSNGFFKAEIFCGTRGGKKKVRSRISRRNSLCLIFLPRRQTRLGTLGKLSSCHARSGSITALGRIAISNSGGGVSSSHAAKRER